MVAHVDWSSLPSELVSIVADCLLATNDVDCYMDLRAVCSSWRSATAGTWNSPDKRFRPTKWIVIDEVSFTLGKSRAPLLVNTATGRVLRKDLPMLHNYHVIAATHGGLFVLADREQPHAACVLNPFTGYMVHYMAPMVTEKVDAAAVHGDALILFCDSCLTAYVANVDSGCFDVPVDKNTYPLKKLSALGIIYTGSDVSKKIFALMRSFAVHPCEMLAIYPFGLVDNYGARNTDRCFLVESDGQMLMIFKQQQQQRMEVFKVENGTTAPEPVKSIGNQAIFLGYRQCLSVNADKFNTVEANCIYYVKRIDSCNVIYKYDIKDAKEEMISGAINTINRVFLTDADSPFTIIQLLASYTFHAWSSELETEKSFEGVPDVIPNEEDSEFSAIS